MKKVELDFEELVDGSEALSHALMSHQPVQLLLLKDGILFPIRIVVSTEYADRLVVQYNGSLRRTYAKDGVKFQRINWVQEYNATVINFADPTLTLDENIQLGWGQMDGVRYAPEEYSEILDVLRDAYEFPDAARTLHFGTSAGGYQAMATAIFDRGSFALTNNPQLDWRKWPTAYTVEQLCFPSSIERLNAEPWRSTIWDLAKIKNYVPRFRMLVNMGSANDYEYQLKGLIHGLRDIGGGKNNFWNCEIEIYEDRELGHTPLPWNALVPEITRELDRLTSEIFQPRNESIVTANPGVRMRPTFANPRLQSPDGSQVSFVTKAAKLDSTGHLYMSPAEVVTGCRFLADIFSCSEPGNAVLTLEFPLVEEKTGEFANWEILLNGRAIATTSEVKTRLPVAFFIAGLSPGDIVSIAIEKLEREVHHSKYQTAKVRPVGLQFEADENSYEVNVTAAGALLRQPEDN